MHTEVQKGGARPNDGARPVDKRMAIEVGCDFLRATEAFSAIGIATVPTRLDDCKVPLVKNADRYGIQGALKIAEKYPVANVGFLCGPRSGITVVDIDSGDIGHLDWVRRTFGHSPVLVQTASGKYHVYYRHNGESRLIRPFADKPIDVLGKGLCVAPPSIRPGMGRYQFIDGDHSDMLSLPTLRLGALQRHTLGASANHCASSSAPGALALTQVSHGPVYQDERNNQLFLFALTPAKGVSDFDALVAILRAENARRFNPPLEDREVQDVAGSVWNYKLQNRLFPKGEQRVVLKATIVAPLLKEGHVDAFALHALLASKHFEKGKRFAIAVNAMAKAHLLGNWSAGRYRNARKRLIDLGILIEVRRGGKGKGDPSIYRFADGAIH